MDHLPTKLLVLNIIPYCDIDTLESVQSVNKYYYNIVQPYLHQQYELTTIQRDSSKYHHDIAIHEYQNIYDREYDNTLQNGFNAAYRDITCSQYSNMFVQHTERILYQYNQQYNKHHELSQLINQDTKQYNQLSHLFTHSDNIRSNTND